ncbi:MAG: hypothetical protein AAFN11_12925 [Chloroflexota bacterium]
MSVAVFIGLIGFVLILAALDSLRQSTGDDTGQTDMPINVNKEHFLIPFGEGQFSPAMRVKRDENPHKVIDDFNLLHPRPTIFITGGASKMSAEDIERTRTLIEDCIAAFAEQHKITIVDGGTEAGVMDMMGDARRKHQYKFPLVGVAPFGKVSFPQHENKNGEAELQDGHSHFVLVESDEWGGESEMIVGLTKAIAQGATPMVGVLINGGKIAEREVYLASATGENRMPLIIIDGSGRTADNISTAFKTQQTDSDLIRAIIKGADIRLTALEDGTEALQKELERVFLPTSVG